ncbi:hypothetical protein D1872_52150 [compost metagenome]
MKVISQDNRSITLELTPIELTVLESAVRKELMSRRTQWKRSNPTVPEELMYYADMKQTTEDMQYQIGKSVLTYKQWGILR